MPKWYYQLVEDFDVYLHAKNKLHHSLLSWKITFYRILQFDWLTAFWPITREPEFCQIWDWWWNINNNIGFHFKLFPGKNNDNIFQKVQKTYLAAIWALFAQIWTKMNFPEKRALSVITYSNYIPLCQKSGKTIEPFLRRTPNWRTDGRTDRQTDNHFIGPSIGWRSKNQKDSTCNILWRTIPSLIFRFED